MLINCDLGEGFGPYRIADDEKLMPFLDLANVACGFHAGDPHIMRRTIDLAIKHGVRVGAHVGYPDLSGFGRRAIPSSESEVVDWVVYQFGALSSMAHAQGTLVEYIKPHGALYHRLHQDIATLDSVCKALANLPERPAIMLMAGPRGKVARTLAKQNKLHVFSEAFADRRYLSDGRLTPRSQPSAVIAEAAEIETQFAQIKGERMEFEDGIDWPILANTLCVHSDSPEALSTLQILRKLLSA